MQTGKGLGLLQLAIAACSIGCGGSHSGSGSSSIPASADPSSSSSPAANSGSTSSSAPTASSSGSKGNASSTPTASTKPAQPVTGATDFLSADTQSSGPNGGPFTIGGAAGAAAPAAPAGSTPQTNTAATDASATTSNRAVERGDVYRVLSDQRMLNLNSYRGVQILDVSDLSHPRVEGRLGVAGDPVELYVVGDRAIVLLNNWQGYYGSRDDVNVESVSGGLVMSVDIHDRAHPSLIAQATVNGWIRTSRLTQGDGQAALYVAASDQNADSTIVKSFDVSDGMLTPKSELDVGGYVQDIQATSDLLLVASIDWMNDAGRSRVAVIDISRPDGTMVKGGDVLLRGQVQNKFNMDAYNGVLRVVTNGSFFAGPPNHLETFSLSDLQKLEKIDDCALSTRDQQNGTTEQLFATLFLGERAFFVTYYRRDPFHAFSIDAQGHCVEHSEFLVSGWNDFLRSTLNDTRLVGIGINDANNTRKLSVSLYDASSLTNPTPLLARADVALDNSYSQASWEDRAFSVLEGAVSVAATDGTKETGLVLLPFQGYDPNSQQEVARVQIFTYSDHTLTLRGTMDHGTPVQRSFEVKDAVTANLSDEQLSVFDTGNPDAPKELGRVDVAPNYSQILLYGDYAARLRERTNIDPSDSQQAGNSTVQIVARNGDLDHSDAVASFEVPSDSWLFAVGKLLVAVHSEAASTLASNNATVYHTKIVVTDLSDPQHPMARGSLETDALEPMYGVGATPFGAPAVAVDCFDCGGGLSAYRALPQAFVVGDAIAFLHPSPQQQSIGTVQDCTVTASTTCSNDKFGNQTCSAPYSGAMTCRTLQGGQESCTGQFYQCGANACQAVDPPANVQRSCTHSEQFRYWTAYGVDTLDLRDPDAPTLHDRIDLPQEDEGTSAIADSTKLYVNYQHPFVKNGDPHSYVKRYVRVLDFQDPSAVARGDGINVPGDVITVHGDDLYTRDEVWNDQTARTLVARLTVSGTLAHLQASQLFDDRLVDAVRVDGAGHVLVSSEPVSTPVTVPVASSGPTAGAPGAPAVMTPQHELSLFDDQTLQPVGEVAVDTWATFKDAQSGRALFQVSGGLLLFDIRDAAHPKAQAYFPTTGWPNQILFDGDEIVFAAGNYGVYRFDANTFNLLMK